MIPKFRAWHKKEKKMYDVIGMQWSGGRLSWVDLALKGFVKYDNLEIEAVILKQSTGLKDKNGKEIFEGDIVEYHHKPTMVERWGAGFSFFDEQKFRIGGIWEDMASKCKIIGNIHENKELMT